MENKQPKQKTTSELLKIFIDELTQDIKGRRERINKEKRKSGYYSISGYDIRILMPLTGYKLIKLKDNKPLTLLNAKAQHKGDFVAFLNARTYATPYNPEGYTRKVFFDLDENKKTKGAGDKLSTDYAYKDARKDEGEIYILLNKDIKTFSEKLAKHNQRQALKKGLTGWERWDASTPEKRYNMRALIDYKHNNYCGNYYYYEEGDLDKSGYLLRYVRQDLKARAEQVRREKAQKERERKEADWIASDKTKYLEELKPYIKTLKGELLKRLTLESVLDSKTYKELDKIRDLLKDFNALMKAENWRNFERWESEKTQTIQEYDFYIMAINRGVLNKIACFHHYEKTATGYKIKDTEKDPFWRDPERYIQAF